MKIVHIEGKGYSRATKDGLARGIPDHLFLGIVKKTISQMPLPNC
jgi:hypothetical protein